MEGMEIEFFDPFGGAFSGRRVLVTGHTGFKGSWLSLWLSLLGADVVGYALPPDTECGIFSLCGLGGRIADLCGDIRDNARLEGVFQAFRPEIVFHLAAQPAVLESYHAPVETFETNLMGTVNVLENIRQTGSVRAGVIVTSDKCYENREHVRGYREEDALGGYDPYSASKGCAELAASAYRRSYSLPVATARAGNVVGGGDWTPDRIVPDCIRALRRGEPVGVRNPDAVRPWQFVLEPLYGYLLLAAKLLRDPEKFAGAWNFGPAPESVVPVKELVGQVIELWGGGTWQDRSDPDAAHEAGLLYLDSKKAETSLGWRQRLSLRESLEWTVDWYRHFESADVCDLCRRQLAAYSARAGGRGRSKREEEPA